MAREMPEGAGPMRQAFEEDRDEAPGFPTQRPEPPVGMYPPQGEHHAAGGLPGHGAADGGLGMGHQFPPGWPKYHP
jgi:hypothetical protein